MKEVFLALGSNLGNREENLNQAINELKQSPAMKFLKKSKWHENPAVEGAGPQDFLNGVIKIETSLSPYELLNFINAIEAKLDPEREERGRKKARYLDIDILLFGDENINDERLVVPHPRMRERSFVMQPLRELQASDYVEDIVQRIDFKSLPDAPSYINQLLESIYKYLNAKEEITIRRMYLSDLDEVMEINASAFGEKHWSKNLFLQELANENSLYLTVVSEESQAVIGFAGGNFICDEMHILTLAVHKDFKCKGIAKALLLALFDSAFRSKAQKVFLEVKLDNHAAIKLYKKFDFKLSGERKAYYEDGSDALIYIIDDIRSEEFVNKLSALI